MLHILSSFRMSILENMATAWNCWSIGRHTSSKRTTIRIHNSKNYEPYIHKALIKAS